MISEPRQDNAYRFSSQFYIQDGASELSDHMTGQHIQGMALIEAARQMMLSVSESYLLDKQHQKTSYFVLNDIQVNFHQFVFPIGCQLEYEVSDFYKN